MPHSVQELEYSWVPENMLFLDHRIVREILQLFPKVSDSAFLPAPSCLVALLLTARQSWPREARGNFAKPAAPFPRGGGGEVSFDWEFNILKS